MTTRYGRLWKRVTIAVGMIVAASYALAGLAPETLVFDREQRTKYIDARALGIDETHGSGRVIILGSSPAVMGLSAAQISVALGRPAINASVLAARPLFARYLQEVLSHVAPGDIVVWADPRLHDLERTDPFADCGSAFALGCFRPHLVALPNLKRLFRFGAEWENWEEKSKLFPGGPQGDLVFAEWMDGPSTAMTVPFDPDFADNIYAAGLKARAMIGARRACAVMAPAPFLIKPSDQARWDAEYRRLLDLADHAPVAPLLLPRQAPFVTDPELLSKFGNGHPSARGRTWWTARLVERLHDLPAAACGRPAGAG